MIINEITSLNNEIFSNDKNSDYNDYKWHFEHCHPVQLQIWTMSDITIHKTHPVSSDIQKQTLGNPVIIIFVKYTNQLEILIFNTVSSIQHMKH